MKTIWLVFSLVFSMLTSIGQGPRLKIIVLDATDNQPLGWARTIVQNFNFISQTDTNGIVEIYTGQFDYDTLAIRINAWSYNDTTINVKKIINDTSIVLHMRPKNVYKIKIKKKRCFFKRKKFYNDL